MIPILEILRLEEHARWGTFGILRIQKQVFCVTLEPPDILNRPHESSIPAQQYMCHKCHSPTFGETWKVMNVPDRVYVLFHAGNVVENTSGCILLAKHYGRLKGDRAVLNSGETFKKFMAALAGYNQAHLTITEHY